MTAPTGSSENHLLHLSSVAKRVECISATVLGLQRPHPTTALPSVRRKSNVNQLARARPRFIAAPERPVFAVAESVSRFLPNAVFANFLSP